MPRKFPWAIVVFAALCAYPLIPDLEGTVGGLDANVGVAVRNPIGSVLPALFIFGMLGLALNVVLGYAGQLHLGIAAFFGIGVFTTGILRVSIFPFQLGF